MTIFLDSLLLLLVAITTAVILIRLAILVKQQKHGNGNARGVMPPGSTGLPLVGETLKLIAAYKTENPESFTGDRVKRYGRLFTSHVFGERTIFSVDPEFNKMVLSGEGRMVECSYPSSIETLLGKHSLLLMRGILHKRFHSFTLTRLASPVVIRDGMLVQQIDRLVRETMAAWGGKVVLLNQAKKITFNLTIKQLVSIDPGEWTETLRGEYVLLIDGFFSVPVPSFLSFTTYGRAIKARKNVAEALREVIRTRIEEKNARREEQESPRVNDIKKDMLEELLNIENGALSEEEIIDFLLQLLVGGYETTSSLITFSVKFLTENPSALAFLREEHDNIRSKKKDQSDLLDWTDYKSMPFTQCVIHEILRIANIVGGVFRRAVTDINFKGYTIPKGCKIFASFRGVHFDPEYYKSAAVFDPWRWQRDEGLYQQVASGGMLTPFGGGARLCPGYELARVVISVFLHNLVTRFSWEAAEEDTMTFFPTTRTVKGYPIFVRHRANSQMQ
ncbi:hypothetical protein LUZ60_015234 [Juncus effusus]|nr:hypothetical protein LUZ60_015234 [Juncus effusus]